MKVCRCCGNTIYTRDGENYCATCDEGVDSEDIARRKRARENRRARADIMRSLGLTRVRGAMGGEYWE